jgi:ABC-2 type transport system ATP-binding protein
VIIVEDFHKAYDETVAVSGLSFEVAPGQVLGLVGPNGAGKTTTLRALAGIIPSIRGRLRVAGHDLDHEPLAAKNCLGYVPDDPQLFRDLTVEQHLAFNASAYRIADAAEKAAELLDMFQLASKRKTRASDLSRGMRQKLAICCAYLHDPVAILFDEPLTGLDPHGIRTLKQSIVDRAERAAAVIVSSHLLAMIEDICTSVLILDEGSQRFCGPLEDFKATFGSGNEDASLEEIYFLTTGRSLSDELVEC